MFGIDYTDVPHINIINALTTYPPQATINKKGGCAQTHISRSYHSLHYMLSSLFANNKPTGFSDKRRRTRANAKTLTGVKESFCYVCLFGHDCLLLYELRPSGYYPFFTKFANFSCTFSILGSITSWQ
jgi:hypothetical protein